MQFQITSIFRVAPEVFWGQLFFEPDYNRHLYEALGFPHCEVEQLERDADGNVHRRLRVVPIIKGPAVVRRKLAAHFFYIEEGRFQADQQLWEFQTIPSLMPENTQIRGVIRTQKEGAGMRHVLDLSASVSAFGLGALFERAIESNTRESYQRTVEFTDAYAADRGLC